MRSASTSSASATYLLGRLADANVHASAPVDAVVEDVEAVADELGEALLGHGHEARVGYDGDEVQLGLLVTRGLVERVLEHDFGVLGQVESDDDAVAIHTRRVCIADAHSPSLSTRGCSRRRAVGA